MGIIAPDHFGLVVRDIKAIKSFYRDLMMFEIAEEFSICEDELSRGLGVEDAELSVIFWNLPGTDAKLEMVEYVRPGVVSGPVAPANTAGFGHLAFRTDDVDAAYERLRDAGVACVSDPVTLSAGVRFFFCRDPEGNVVELIQHPA